MFGRNSMNSLMLQGTNAFFLDISLCILKRVLLHASRNCYFEDHAACNAVREHTGKNKKRCARGLSSKAVSKGDGGSTFLAICSLVFLGGFKIVATIAWVYSGNPRVRTYFFEGYPKQILV